MPTLRQTDALAGLLLLTQCIYGLHAFAVLTGVLTSATVIGSFLASVPSVFAVILNYLKRPAVRGTWLDSHFRWQIRTFWLAALAMLLAVVLALTLVGIPLALVLAGMTSLWVIYRVVRGWWCLNQRIAMPVPLADVPA